MADKEKKVAQNSDVEKATTDESKAAAKVAKAAKGNNKKDKPNFFVRTGKGGKRFFKDFKGECKKIVWPDAKTVLKSTGVVLLVVAIVCIVVYAIDQGLSAGIGGLKSLAMPETTVAETVEGETTGENEEGAAESEETTAAAEETTEEATEATKASE